MKHDSRAAHLAPAASFRDLFTPKLVTVLREGYGLTNLRADAISGLTVAIVALPLSMAIAIASGVSPDRGLYTAIVGGFLVSLLGGSRFQIGGPAGAFIVLIAASVQRHGLDGMLLATFMAGVIMLAIGFLRLGTFIKFIPYPVTIGFTAGIGIIILSSQLRDLFGLTLSGPEPAEFLPKMQALVSAANTVTPAAVGIAIATIGIILGLRRWKPSWPGLLIAVVATSVAVPLFGLGVETIGSRFGGIPRTLPAPHLPEFSIAKMQAVLPDAIAFALLGAIESLLSAVVADGMSGRRHRSNCELVAQGVANMGSAMFGGVPVTGTIARTATNVRAGAHGPVSGILHAAFLLGFMLIAAPLAAHIPLAALAGVLVVVSINMIEREAIKALVSSSWGDAVVLGVTFLLVVFRDLTEGIVVGFVLGALLFIHRMSTAISIDADQPDSANRRKKPYDPHDADDPETVIYRISGAFFFGTASMVSSVLDRIADQRKNFIIDFSNAPMIDSTAANVVEGAARKAHKAEVRILITGASPQIRRMLVANGVHHPLVEFFPSIEDALAEVHHAPG
ncbi:SulP family inorganic anion transporter [Aquamicrobium zhengzhouense]|uniref:SulP family inorganic anion transporter n=1 Tax=Aquamicrobium zhengzhouense TaxID=2781738 RepID=A0ABS0SF17_9HYPH|nr:SulP family inorganic anion transporter [Aquamicrobium zhengzhouense]MBI1621899.1 SulP family inorganic anion transporter [Aquamicrobium zhengzhouense]